jgi:hypothetical protein
MCNDESSTKSVEVVLVLKRREGSGARKLL